MNTRVLHDVSLIRVNDLDQDSVFICLVSV